MSMYSFNPRAALADIAALRAARLETLTALPEFFVEASVRRSAVYAIEKDGVIGYLAVLEGILTEVYLMPSARADAGAVLERAARDLDLQSAWACTFDPLALAACTAAASSHEEIGLSFRALHAVSLPTPEPLPTERVATAADIDLVHAASHPDVFDDPGEIAVWVNHGWVTLFERPAGVVGFGLCTPTGPETPAADIGIRVCEPYQRRGLGAWIVQRMIARAKAQGLIPTAGCDIDNIASRRTLERGGFEADHRLLQFTLGRAGS